MPRPHTPLLSPESIVSAALALVDETGDFSFPKVARRLGVAQSALYNHIEGREHIVELMRGRLFGDRARPQLDGLPWDDALRTLVRSYRDGFAAHPRLVPMLVSQTVRDLGVMGLYEDIAAALHRAGLDERQILPAIATIDYLALGAALELTAPAEVWSRDARFPLVSSAVEASGDAPEQRAEAAFAFAVEVLIAGVRAQVARPGA